MHHIRVVCFRHHSLFSIAKTSALRRRQDGIPANTSPTSTGHGPHLPKMRSASAYDTVHICCSRRMRVGASWITSSSHEHCRCSHSEWAHVSSCMKCRRHSPTAPQPHGPTAPQPHSPTAPRPHSPTAPRPRGPTAPRPHGPA